MNRSTPWSRLESIIEPFYPKAGKRRRPYPLATSLRIYCLQQWSNFGNLSMEEELSEIASMRAFAKLSLSYDSILDETTILNFRYLLEQHDLTSQILNEVTDYLQARGLVLRQGTIVDAMIIAAPSSTKNATGEHGPEMHQTKKGNRWLFGMKAHVGVDAQSRLVHSVTCTPANEHDLNQADHLMHAKEEYVFVDAGYQGVTKRKAFMHSETEWHVAERPGRIKAMKKNGSELNMLFALSNLFQARRKLLMIG